MARVQSRGACLGCGKTFTKSGMARHLAACEAAARVRPEVPSGFTGRNRKDKPGLIYRIAVEGRDANAYWMIFEVRAADRLEVIDEFLRDIWLECCGHLSDFRFPAAERAARARASRGFDEMVQSLVRGVPPGGPFGDFFDEPGATLQDSIQSRVDKGDQFIHEYDFGSTTELSLKVLDAFTGSMTTRSVRLLARNDPPEILCACGQPATKVDSEYMYEDNAWMCDACAQKHAEDDEVYLLPVVNSPRVGVCGYCGPEH